MNNQITYCIGCGVPNHLHGTYCGWTNANQIIIPTNGLEKQWQAIQEEAHRQLFGGPVPAVVSMDFANSQGTVIVQYANPPIGIASGEIQNCGFFSEPVLHPYKTGS